MSAQDMSHRVGGILWRRKQIRNAVVIFIILILVHLNGADMK